MLPAVSRADQIAPCPAAGSFPAVVKLLLLVNESASWVTPRSRVVIQKALAADHDVTLAEGPVGHAPSYGAGIISQPSPVLMFSTHHRRSRGGSRGSWVPAYRTPSSCRSW